MAQKKIIKRVCDRCPGRDVPSTVTARLTIEGISYELDLCDRHLHMFDRDMSAWTRTATEVRGNRPITTGPVDRTPIRIPQAPQVVEISEPDVQRVPVRVSADDMALASGLDMDEAARWKFTESAGNAMQTHNVTPLELMWVILHPDIIRDGDTPDVKIHRRGSIWVILNPGSKTVITASRKNLDLPARRYAVV